MNKQKFSISLYIKGSKIDLQNTINVFNKNEDINIKIKPSTPLHLGEEEAIVVLSILGSLASLVSLINSFLRKKNEIEIKSKTGEIIKLSKNKPWTIKDLKKILKLDNGK